MQLIPSALVSTVRAALSSQKIDPLIIDNSGAVDAQRLVAAFFDTAEIRTTATPTVSFSLVPTGEPPGAMSQLLAELQPSVVLKGRAGTVNLAPLGKTGAQKYDLKEVLLYGGAGTLAGLVGLKLLLGAIGRARAPRPALPEQGSRG